MIDVKLLAASAQKSKPRKTYDSMYLSFDKITAVVPKETWLNYVQVAKLLNLPNEKKWIQRIGSILLHAADKQRIECRKGIRGNTKSTFKWRKEE